MNTAEIDAILSFHSSTRPHYIGTFPVDLSPNCVLPRPSICIVNSDTSKSPGKHWLCFFLPDDALKSVEFFDSFGRKPKKYFFERFIAKNTKICVYNPHVIQNFNSFSCGMFVCLFALYRSLGFSMQSFCDLFVVNTETNEKIVRDLFQFHFGSLRHQRSHPLPSPSTIGYPCSLNQGVAKSLKWDVKLVGSRKAVKMRPMKGETRIL